MIRAFLLLVTVVTVTAQQRNVSLENEVERAIERGADWLVKSQAEKGNWSTTDHPAISALVLVALQGKGELDADEKTASKKGYEFLLSNVHEDGTIHGGKGLVNYNTSIGLLALVAAKEDRYRPQIVAGRKYLVGTQIDMGEKGKLDTRFDGGVGYGSKYEHSDMANTLQALEALYYSKQFATDSGATDLDWKAAIHFLQNCQNLPSHNPQASPENKDRGGFVYHPEESKAGTNTINGRVALRSYGSISYAGLLSYIYADLDKSDPRVKAVVEWLEKNFTLAENPGMGAQGLYYYFHTMTKALTAYGIDELPTKSGGVNWREQLALKLINLQKRDGSWENENGRWFEKDPALVTAYAMITLGMIQRGL